MNGNTRIDFSTSGIPQNGIRTKDSLGMCDVESSLAVSLSSIVMQSRFESNLLWYIPLVQKSIIIIMIIIITIDDNDDKDYHDRA